MRAGLRMILQPSASHPKTFTPSVLSLPPEKYSQMMTEFRLPYKGLEGSGAAGPLFWTSFAEEHQILQTIYRKHDFLENGGSWGWEVFLSHRIGHGVTTGFCKATMNTSIADWIKHLKASSNEIAHPMLFPVIVFSHYNCRKIESWRRDARDIVRKIERAFSTMRKDGSSHVAEAYVDEQGLIDFDTINKELTECHRDVIKRGSFAYLQILDGFDEAMTSFAAHQPSKETNAIHSNLESRIAFYKKKLRSEEQYQFATLQRLEVQRSALAVACGQIDNRVNFQIAEAQTKLAHSNKREAVSQKVIAILGTVFLPGAFLSSLFSMTFFDWQSTKSDGAYVSPLFWVYWAISIPLTVAVVGTYVLWDRKLSLDANKEEGAIELRMLEMKRNSQNRAVKSAATLVSGFRSVQKA